MSEAEEFEELGFGILRYAGPDPSRLVTLGLERFLDELWLPCPLAELSEDQIFIINRHRENVIGSDSRYENAMLSRARLADLAQAVDSKYVVEVGCGKFPIAVPKSAYLGLDIDPTAILFLRSQGYQACHPKDFREACRTSINTTLSSFALHFKVENTFFAELAALSAPDGIFAFSIILDDCGHLMALLESLAPEWPIIQIVKTSRMARRECLIVAGKEGSVDRVLIAAGHARMFDQAKV